MRARGLQQSPAGPADAPFRWRIERFECAPEALMLRLHLRLPFEIVEWDPSNLLVEHEREQHAFAPLVVCTGRTPLLDATRISDRGDWIWRATFAVPHELALSPRAQFALALHDGQQRGLPRPGRAAPASGGNASAGARLSMIPQGLRKTALTAALVAQLTFAAGSPAAALAAGGATSGEVEPAGPADLQTGESETAETPAAPEAQPPVQTGVPSSGETGTGEPPQLQTGEGTEQEAVAEVQPAPASSGEEAPASAPVPGGPAAEEQATDTSSPAGHAPAADPTGGTPAPADLATQQPLADASATLPPAAGATGDTHKQKGSKKDAAPKRTRWTHRPAWSAPTAHVRRTEAPGGEPAPEEAVAEGQGGTAAPDMVASPGLGVSISPLSEAELLALSEGYAWNIPGLGDDAAIKPPAYLIPIYKKAGARYGVPWKVLAAINSMETNYGRDLRVSSAGALGWMQFMPTTWTEWGVRADHREAPNPYSPQDAIFTAARYLQAAGADTDLTSAIFAYNHADWYVSSVLTRAAQIGVPTPGTATVASLQKPPAAERALIAAMSQIGTTYVWGGEQEHTAFDCSGLVQWSFAKAGVALPRTAQEQYDATARIEPQDARPGDLVFFGSSTAGVGHVGIVVGPGLMLDATHTGAFVEYSSFIPRVGAPFGSELVVGFGHAATPDEAADALAAVEAGE